MHKARTLLSACLQESTRLTLDVLSSGNSAAAPQCHRQRAHPFLHRVTGEGLITGIAYGQSNTSYDDLLWFSLAYIRAHELCIAQPSTCTCTLNCNAPSGGTLLNEGWLIFDCMYNNSWNQDYCTGGFCWALTAQNYTRIALPISRAFSSRCVFYGIYIMEILQ